MGVKTYSHHCNICLGGLTELVNVKLTERANQIKEGGAYCY